jgi:TRAP-type C4-dicarboxylate transport system permease small subunit
METFFHWSGRISAALAVISKLLLGLIVVLVVADVGMRNLSKPIAWSASLTEYLLIYIAFLAAPALVRAKGHVCADFMRLAMPRGMRRVVEKAVYVLCIGLCLHLGWIAGQGMIESLRTGSYDVRTFDLPKWLIYLPMVLGLWLSALEFLRFLTGRDSIYALDISEMEGF